MRRFAAAGSALCSPGGALDSPVRRLSLLVALLLVVIPGAFETASAGPTTTIELRVRKDVKDLSPQEKKDFVDAVLELKQTPSPFNPKFSYYDQFVWWHRQAFLCNIDAAHMWAAFLPWHREYLLLFEKALRQVSGDPNLTIPVLGLDRPELDGGSLLPEFHGRHGRGQDDHYAVMNGPFRAGQWRLNVVDPKSNDPYGFTYLVRRFGTNARHNAPDRRGGVEALSAEARSTTSRHTTQREAVASSFRQYLEGWRSVIAHEVRGRAHERKTRRPNARRTTMHNAVHLWVGGVWAFDEKRERPLTRGRWRSTRH